MMTYALTEVEHTAQKGTYGAILHGLAALILHYQHSEMTDHLWSSMQ